MNLVEIPHEPTVEWLKEIRSDVLSQLGEKIRIEIIIALIGLVVQILVFYPLLPDKRVIWWGIGVIVGCAIFFMIVHSVRSFNNVLMINRAIKKVKEHGKSGT